MCLKIAERVIIDRSDFDPELYVLPAEKAPVSLDYDGDREEYAWDDLPSTHQFSDEQAQFCPAFIPSTSISSERTHLVSVERLSSVDWNKQALESLVLPSHQKSMLRSLVQQQTGSRARKRW